MGARAVIMDLLTERILRVDVMEYVIKTGRVPSLTERQIWWFRFLVEMPIDRGVSVLETWVTAGSVYPSLYQEAERWARKYAKEIHAKEIKLLEVD
jgi:hypothetical protein